MLKYYYVFSIVVFYSDSNSITNYFVRVRDDIFYVIKESRDFECCLIYIKPPSILQACCTCYTCDKASETKQNLAYILLCFC